jgi:hypothetical protein
LLTVLCAELTVNEQRALEAVLADQLAGRAVVLNKGDEIAFDPMTDGGLGAGDVMQTVERFVSKRKDSRHYSVEAEGDKIRIRSPDPIAAERSRRESASTLPPNLMQCPFCPFVTPYEEMYTVHLRAHLFGV